MKRLVILLPIVLVLLIGTASANGQRINESSRSGVNAIDSLQSDARVNESAQSGYDLSWYTIDGGGATFSTDGSYSLGGSIGQPDAGSMSGGSYTLNGGFWGGASIANYTVYLPLVRK